MVKCLGYFYNHGITHILLLTSIEHKCYFSSCRLRDKFGLHIAMSMTISVPISIHPNCRRIAVFSGEVWICKMVMSRHLGCPFSTIECCYLLICTSSTTLSCPRCVQPARTHPLSETKFHYL